MDGAVITLDFPPEWLTDGSLSEGTRLGILAWELGPLGGILNRMAQRHALLSELSALKAMKADGKTLDFAIANLETFLADEDANRATSGK